MTSHRRTFIKNVGLGTVGLGAALFYPIQILARENHDGLPRSSPEAQGVASGAVLRFLAAWAQSSEPHSFMMLRRGHVIAEGWWAPYRPEATHPLNSLSKSFTSTAVGFAVAEGKLKLDDNVTTFFPHQLPSNVSANLAALRVRDLLTMSAGHHDGSNPITQEQDWVKAFLAMPIEHPPGSVFLYDPGATYMLSAIVQQVSGQKLIDYLQTRLFEPLEVHGMTWDTCPRGINTGGWGLNTTTETVAKFGQLYLQKGQWNGRQLLPADWVEQATSLRIQTHAEPHDAIDPDWQQGYGYQIWRCRHNAFRGDGAFGQFCIVMPDQDAVIAITGLTGDMQGVLNLVWTHLLTAMHEGTLPTDAAQEKQLRDELTTLQLPLPSGAPTSGAAVAISEKTFLLEPNSLGAKSVSFRFGGKSGVFTLKDENSSHEIQCGIGIWIDGVTDMPPTDDGPSAPHPPVKVAAAIAWQNGTTLEIRWHYYEVGYHDAVTCRFEGDKVAIDFLNGIAQISPIADRSKVENRPALKGRVST